MNNMMRWLKRQLDEICCPNLDWVQIEVTTHCNASCIYCPHTVMKDRWANMHMSLELFCKLTPFLRNTKMIYLQGWGEPLLCEDIFGMIRICKDQGKVVGFTTNGMLLTEETILKLIDLEVDILGVSLAGTTATTHNKIRKGTDFDTVISSLKLLHRIKLESRRECPAVHLAYLMLKLNFHELNGIVSLAKGMGAQQIVAGNLNLILNPKLCTEAIFNDREHADQYRTTLEEIIDRAANENIIFHYHGPSLNDASMRCSENVHCACVINVEGEVSPCVFTTQTLCKDPELSKGQSTHYIFEGQLFPLEVLSFGNIRDESLTRIWKKREYTRFRDLFDPEVVVKTEQIMSEMPRCCVKCYKRLGA